MREPSSKGMVSPWTDVYGLARSSIAFGTLLTFLFNSTDILIRPVHERVSSFYGNSALSSLSLFQLVPPGWLEFARWIAILILLATASGWRPRVTALPHWWVSFSFVASAPNLDGGDHVAAVITLLLLPIALTDSRKWHWGISKTISTPASAVAAEVAKGTRLAIRVQVAFIYGQAAIAKTAVPQWVNGTALYYWFTNPLFGAPGWLQPIVRPLVLHPVSVTALTWGAMLVELLLFMAIMSDRKWWNKLLVLGLVFHASIAVVHGLWSFFFSMAGALILYLRPPEHAFSFSAGAARLLAGRRSLLRPSGRHF